MAHYRVFLPDLDFYQQTVARQTLDKPLADGIINLYRYECEVREAYESSEGLIEHHMHIGEA